MNNAKDYMDEQELVNLWNEMRVKRMEQRMVPYEPAPVAFAKEAVKIAFERGYDIGWKECAESEVEVYVFRDDKLMETEV